MLLVFAAAGVAIGIVYGWLKTARARRTEEAERLSQITDSLPQMLWTARPDWVCDYANARWFEYSGTDPGEPFGWAWSDFVHPDDWPAVSRFWEELRASGKAGASEFRLRRHDGEYRWFEAHVSAVRDKDERIVKWVGRHTDIQDARELREAARPQTERFAQIVAASQGAVLKFGFRPDGSLALAFASTALREIFDLPAGEVADDAGPVFERIHPADRRRVRDSMGQSAERTTLWSEEFRVCRPGKGEIKVAGQAAAVREADGIVGWYGLFFEVAENSTAEARLLRRTEQELPLLQTLIEQAPFGILLLDRGMRQIQVSRRWLRNAGQTREAVLGKSHYETFPDLPPHWMECHRRALAGMTVRGQEERFTTPDGEEHWANWMVAPWGDLGETTGGIVIYAEDITERRRMEGIARKHELEYRALFDHLSEGFAHCQVIFDGDKPLDFLYLSVNKAFGPLTGLCDVAGRRASETLPRGTELEPEGLALLGRVALTGVPEKREIYLKRTAEWYSFSVYSPEREFVVILIDVITERKRADFAVRQWQIAFDQSETGIALENAATNTIEAVNRAYARRLGFTQEELTGRPCTDLYPPESLAERSAALRIADSETGHVLFETRHLRKDGSSIPVKVDLTSVRDEEANLNSRVEIVHDLTDRKRSEAILREREHTMRALLDSAAQAILAVNREGRIVLLNRMAGEMFGYGAEELLGQPLEILMTEKVRGTHASHRAEYFLNPRVRPMGRGMELEGARRDGTTFPVEVSLSFIQTLHGGTDFPFGADVNGPETAADNLAVAFVSDITQRKRMEQAALADAQEIRALAASLLTAQEAERRRVSRELHDQICQQLAALAIDMSGLTAEQPAAGGELPRRLKELQTRVIMTSEATRHIAHELRPSMLDDLGLAASLQALCREFSEKERITVQFKKNEGTTGRLPREAASCLYRVAQESLNNIAKHSHARLVSVVFTFRTDAVTLSVSDQGDGFDLAAAKGRGGLGLIGMEERARLVGGKLLIDARPGRGTRITIEVPLSVRTL
jgi:PAS domain S-box-containing protein